jgi:potassium channel subfamily K protein 1
MIPFLQTPNERLCLLILFYIFYLFFGALMFDAVESPHEAKIVKNLNDYVKKFRLKHNSCLTDDELTDFIRIVSIANNRGVPASRNVSKEPSWSFGQAVFFSGTVLTTIGYGDVYPQTSLGKIFCIIFAMFGIPATLLLLTAIIERLMTVSNVALELFTDKVQPLLNRLNCLTQRKRLEGSHMHVLFALLCAFVVFILFYIIPAAVYSHIENWSFLNAFYYCFISLTTVGLGDYVPGDSDTQEHRHLYKIFSVLYLIIGVATMVWLLEIFSATPEFNFYKYITLTKDGVLTSHQKTYHTAAASSISGNTSMFSPGKSLFSNDNSMMTYQQNLNESELNQNSGSLSSSPYSSPSQYDPIQSNDTVAGVSASQNDDELILTRSSSNNNQNYSSLAETNRS